jgi:hypothetical protein
MYPNNKRLISNQKERYSALSQNKKNMKQALIIIASLLTIGILIASIGISASNKEITLRSKITAQKEVVEAFYDKLWKIISQKADVTAEYKDSFHDIYADLIEGRYGNEKGGSLMKWVTESNPNFDVSLYKDLMSSIESERSGFFMEQKKLTDLNNEHRIVRGTFPNSLFIGGRPDIEIKIISSDKTKKVMETGEENDVELFKKDKK